MLNYYHASCGWYPQVPPDGKGIAKAVARMLYGAGYLMSLAVPITVALFFGLVSHALGQGAPEILWRTNGHSPDEVLSLGFSPDSTMLASGGGDSDMRVKVWRVSDGSLVRTLAHTVSRVESVAFSPDGKMLAATGGEYGNVPAPDFRHYNLINLWDTTDWSWRGVTNFYGYPTSLAFSHDGSYLAVACGYYPGDVALFEMPSASLVTRYARTLYDGYFSLAFSPDDRELATGPFGTEIRNAINGTVRLALSFGGSVGFSPDGGTLMVAEHGLYPDPGIEGAIYLVDVVSGAIRTSLPHPGTVYRAAFTPDGKAIVSWAGDNKIRFWSLRDYSVFQVYDQETTNVWGLAVAPNGCYFAYGRNDGVVVLGQMPLWITDITRLNNQVRLTWSGGTGRYQLLRTTALSSGVWENVGDPTTETNATVAATSAFEFFRVQSLAQP